jgi:hypothetical protein
MDKKIIKNHIKIKYSLKFILVTFVFVPLFLLALLYLLFYLEENPIKIYFIIFLLVMNFTYIIGIVFFTFRYISINDNGINLGRFLLNDITLKFPVIYYLEYNNLVINNKYRFDLENITNKNQLENFLLQGENDQKMIRENSYYIDVKFKSIIFFFLNIFISYVISSSIVIIIYRFYNNLSLRVFVLLLLILFILSFFFFFYLFIRKKY